MREPRAASPVAAPQDRILGVDPGTRLAGWAILDPAAPHARRVAGGVWRLGSSAIPLPERLQRLAAALEQVLEEHTPRLLALEAAFFGRNARSALRIGEARGVVMMAAARRGVPVVEIPPATVKRRVTGAGAASKEQVDRLVRMHVGEPQLRFEGRDESDALAIALCAWMSAGTSRRVPARTARRGSLPAGARLQ